MTGPIFPLGCQLAIAAADVEYSEAADLHDRLRPSLIEGGQ
jgi:hypothetical protein